MNTKPVTISDIAPSAEQYAMALVRAILGNTADMTTDEKATAIVALAGQLAKAAIAFGVDDEQVMMAVRVCLAKMRE